MGYEGFTPHHLDQALQYIHAHGDETTILAGGTDILVRYHERMYELKRIMNICELEELKCIKIVDDEIEVGSLVTHTQLTESSIILNHVPFLADSALSVGAPQIRNRGTIGGNVANASPASDLMPVLLTLDAKVKMFSLDRGERVLAVKDFVTGPGRNVLKKDELLTSITFTVPKEHYCGKFCKLGYRKAQAISTVNVAVLMALRGNFIEDIRIALGAVAPTPIRALLTEETLRGKTPDFTLLQKAIEQVGTEISPISDVRGTQTYRLDVSKEMVGDAIRALLLKGGIRK